MSLMGLYRLVAIVYAYYDYVLREYFIKIHTSVHVIPFALVHLCSLRAYFLLFPFSLRSTIFGVAPHMCIGEP